MARNEETMKAMCSLLTKDPRLTLRTISEQLKIGKDTVSTIIHGDLNVEEKFVRVLFHIF